MNTNGFAKRFSQSPITPARLGRAVMIVGASAGLMFGLANGVNASQMLAQQKNCMTCHSIQNRVLGPSFKEISSKYANQAGAESNLVKKVVQGGSGNWGAAAMPANTQLSQADATTLVRWILSLK